MTDIPTYILAKNGEFYTVTSRGYVHYTKIMDNNGKVRTVREYL